MLFNERMGFFMAELDALHDYIMVVVVAISYLLTVGLYRIFSSKFF